MPPPARRDRGPTSALAAIPDSSLSARKLRPLAFARMPTCVAAPRLQFVRTDGSRLEIGAGGHFGLMLDSDLSHGASGRERAYDSKLAGRARAARPSVGWWL